MSLFQCEYCGCVENTALSTQGFTGRFQALFDWSYAPERAGKRLCSACGPVKYHNGEPTEYGKWHNVFARQYLPLGKFKTNDQGNLEYVETGETDYQNYLVPPSEVSKP